VTLLVGLERGWRERDAPDHSRTAGIRTFGVSGLLGGVVAALADALGAASVLVGGFIAFAAVLAWYKAREAAHDDDFSDRQGKSKPRDERVHGWAPAFRRRPAADGREPT
jgi:hypothetical protein